MAAVASLVDPLRVAADYPAIPSTHAIEQGLDIRIVGASTRGRGHEIRGQARQDAIGAAHTGDWSVLAVADGVGSEQHSALGAAAAAQAAVHWFSIFAGDCELAGARAARMSLSRARAAVLELAHRQGCDVQALASTLLVAGVRESPHETTELVVSWTGDGAVLVWKEPSKPLVRVFGQAEPGAPDTVMPIGLSQGRDWHANSFSQDLPGYGWRIALMSDGLSDDFGHDFQMLCEGLDSCKGDVGSLVRLLGYRKRGSFDDRSVVLAESRRIENNALG